MQNLDTALYDYLETAFSSSSHSSGSAKTLKQLKVKLRKFAHRTGIKTYDLEEGNASEFDRVWLLDFNKSTKNLRDFYVVGLNTQTQEIEILKIKGLKGAFKKPEDAIISYFVKNNETPYPAFSRTSQNIRQRVTSTSDFLKALEIQRKRTVLSLKDSFRTAHRTQYNATLGMSFLDATSKKASELLVQSLQNVLDEVEKFTDPTSKVWSIELREEDCISAGYTEFELYNHIVNALSPHVRGYRYTALKQFSPLGCLYLDSPIWDKIDGGQSPMKTLANHMGVTQATLKRMAQMQDVFELGENTQQYAVFLDKIAPAYWPSTKQEFFHFCKCLEITELYDEYFDKDPVDSLSGWIKGQKHNQSVSKEHYWNTLSFKLLSPTIHIMQRDPSKHMKFVPKRNRSKLWGNSETRYKNPQDMPVNLNNMDRFWNNAVKKLKENISSIKDMKDDISKRLIKPSLLLAFEEMGIKVAETSILDNLGHDIQQEMWRQMSPADQIASNSYWHSPQVDILQRFRSAALVNSGYQEWPPLVDEQTLKSGITMKPLLSAEALREEGSAMSHCIGGYASNFFTRNYHFFSIRDGSGERLSSLTVLDKFEDNKRVVEISQNKAFDNRAPSRDAKDATRWLIKTINEGKLKPDWKPIDEARGDYKIKAVENAAGYDIRDEERRQAVFQIYASCLPKKYTKSGNRTYDDFLSELDIQSTVSDFLRTFDFSKGGLLRKEEEEEEGMTQPKLTRDLH